MIETQNFSITYTADGEQTEWAFPYPYLSSNDVKLYTIVNGVKTLVDTTYYSFDTSTNKITYPLSGSPVTIGTLIYLERQTPITQEENSSLGNFKSDDVERIADKLTMISQEVTKASGDLYIDDSLSANSENAVQNRVITAQINSINANKQDKLPSGTTGTYLQKTNTGVQWSSVDALPSQTGHNGKFLTTNGTSASWKAVPARNIGEIVPSTVPLTDSGLHLLDGSLISAGSYLAFVDYISGLMTDYPDLFETEANWQSAVTTYGVCGKFVYDGVNRTVRLPKITGFIEGTTDATALGDLVEAGLPNITGGGISSEVVYYDNRYANGAFYTGDTGAADRGVPSGNTCTYAYWNFDASRSNPIYDNSSTVQPQAIKTLYYIVIATTTKTDIQVDIDEIATDLNGKADVDLTNVNNTGSSRSAGWALPSTTYDALTFINGAEYTAPANGYFCLSGYNSNGNLNNVAGLENTTTGTGSLSVPPIYSGSIGIWTVAAQKGQKVVAYNYNGTVTDFRFVYAEGSKSEAN